MDLGYKCSVTVATDSQSVIDHSRIRGHSVVSKHVLKFWAKKQKSVSRCPVGRVSCSQPVRRHEIIGNPE